MLWDKYNIQTPGASVSYLHPLGPASSLTFTAAGVYSAQHFQDESILGVGQVLWKWGDESRFAIEASGAFWNMDMRNVAAAVLPAEPDDDSSTASCRTARSSSCSTTS